jgi:hypothetical protein
MLLRYGKILQSGLKTRNVFLESVHKFNVYRNNRQNAPEALRYADFLTCFSRFVFGIFSCKYSRFAIS